MSKGTPHIVFLHKDFPLSGAEQVTIDIANYLCRKGYRVTVLTMNHHEEKYPEGTQCLFGVSLLPKGKFKYSRRIAQAVKDFVEKEQVEVMVTYREIFYAHWLKRQTGVKMVFELHNMPYYEYIDIADKRRESRWKDCLYGCGIEWLLRLFYKQKYRRVYGWCDAYGLLCEGYRQRLVDELSLTDDHKTWVLPNPIGQPKHVVTEKEKVVVYVGRLTHRDKRVDRLLCIWQKAQDGMPDWQLMIVGAGKASESLKALAGKLCLERVSFEGYSSHVKDYYDRAAILCLTSSIEGWPMCVAEAQANGVVPIVFDSFAGASDQISSPEEGILITPYDEEAFARQLMALAADEERLKKMCHTVRAKSLTYHVDRSGQAWERMLAHLMQSKT